MAGEGENKEKIEKPARRRKLRTLRKRMLIYLSFLGFLCFLFGFLSGLWTRGLFIKEPVDLVAIRAPQWIDQQFLTINEFSRPGTRIQKINQIVVHYIGNAGTTAQQNRDYFESLKNQTGGNTTSVSSNFVIGLDGEIIQCIPISEKAYASNHRNSDTVSIECCHPGTDGKFTQETYDSLVKLTAWLCKELDLTEKDIIRHYEVTGKICPKYYVENEGEWKLFLKDVKKALKKL